MSPERIIIIANGDLKDLSFYHGLFRDDDYILCVNGGTAHAFSLGLEPDLVIGDLDSMDSADRKKLETMKTELISHPAEKDKSDLELALEQAVALNPAEILIIGALGGSRFDHAFINVLLLFLPLRKGIPASIVDERQELMLVQKEVVITGSEGDSISLFALTNTVQGVVTEGLKYPLKDQSLSYASTRGLSNELISPQAKISIKEGLLLLIKTTADAPAVDFSWTGH